MQLSHIFEDFEKIIFYFFDQKLKFLKFFDFGIFSWKNMKFENFGNL